jgi:two-component sensor histidine kinase
MTTRTTSSLWIWRGVWTLSLLVALGVTVLYVWLPVDGATGDLESFASEGYRVQWLLEERKGGLQIGDVIVRAGGYTPEEWLRGVPRGAEWRNGEVTYQIVRDGKPVSLDIQLSPVPLEAILTRWTLQLLGAVASFLVGTLVFWRRPQDPAARLLMLFCIAVALQYWGDAYNLQFSALLWGWPFWLHVVYEHSMYSLGIATVCYFALVFPTSHPLLERFPRRVVFVLYASHPLIIMGTMALFPTRSTALTAGSHASWLLALVQMGLAVVAGARSVRTAHDPVARAQVRWILWSAVVGGAVLIPGYVLPLVFGGHPLLSHPVMMVMVIFVPTSFAIAILRYHLFDIEIIINRSLVYGTLTTLLAGLYLLLVRILTIAIQGILHQENDTLVVFTATLSIALAFAPLRQRVQVLIDRTFYRAKPDYQRLLPEISERLATSIVLNQLVPLLTVELPQRLQLKWATLAILDSTGGHFARAGDENHPGLRADHSLVEYLRHSRPILRLQPPPHLPANMQTFLNQHEIELSIPLIVGAEMVGLYNLGPKRSGDPYNQDEVRFLQLLGQQAAVTVENSRLLQMEREQRQLAEALSRAAAVVSSTLNLDQVLDRILEQAEQVVAGDASYVVLLKGSDGQVIRRRGYEQLQVANQLDSDTTPLLKLSVLKETLQTGKPVVVQDTTADSEWTALPDRRWRRSHVAVPIRIAGQIVGTLNMDGTRPGQFTPTDARRLEVFTHHAATALQNAQLYEQAQKEIAERVRAEGQVKASLREKEVLLQEIHHRVKNNLQIVSSLLYLQAQKIEDPQALGIFQDGQNRIRSMALIHEKLYQTQDLARVDFGDYIHNLIAYLFQVYSTSAQAISLEIRADNVFLPIGIAVPCGLLLNELISNTLKHAFPGDRGGQVCVELCTGQDCQYILKISDDGVGLPPGLDLHTTESLGLQLVNTLVDQVGGTIELHTRGGTEYKITFPAP